MEPRLCDNCGKEMEDDDIRHRRQVFCSDECCEEFEDRFLENGEPDELDLDDPFDGDLDEVDEEGELEGLDADDDLDPLADDDVLDDDF